MTPEEFADLIKGEEELAQRTRAPVPQPPLEANVAQTLANVRNKEYFPDLRS